MDHERIMIMDIPIDNVSKSTLVRYVYDELEQKRKNIFIVTANPEIIMNAKRLSPYRESILQADFVIADGIGVIKAAEILRRPLAEKIVGYELLHTFLAYASEHEKSVYFFGGKEGVAVEAAINAATLYPNFRIAGTKNGYSGLGPEVAEEIAATKPDFLFVGLGAPLQENWIAANRHLFPTSVLMGVGGSFDVLSGQTKRAPQFWLDRNLEWMYRLLTQPTRSKRMIQLPLFAAEVYRQKWHLRRVSVHRKRHV